MYRQVDPWGRVKFHSTDAVELLMHDQDISELLFEPDEVIEQYNEACRRHDKSPYLLPEVIDPAISPEQTIEQRTKTWFMPAEYRERDVRAYLLSLCSQCDEVARVNHEMDLFEQRGFVPVIQLMMYLVDQFRANGIVWGVGRGSSVASYCLFLIGVHKINSLAFDLPIEEFLH